MLRYHDITKDDMKNGDGLRVVLWLSGCSHHCEGCQNPITWDPTDGLEFDDAAKQEIFDQLDKDYISGLTLSGGDPLYITNLTDVWILVEEVKEKYPDKTIWLYTGFSWEMMTTNNGTLHPTDMEYYNILKYVDVLVDGRFVKELADVKYPWAGSTNQRVIDVQKSLQRGEVVKYVTV